jgi:hypothetical protein
MHTTTQNLSLPLPITATFTNNNITCYGAHDGILTVNPSGGNDGFTYLWSNSQTSRVISSLASGTYLVTVTDIKNCTGIFDTIVPPQPDSLSVSLLAKQDADCKGSTNGYIHINVGGGTTTYQYAWSNGVTIKDNDGIKPNTYTLTVTDQNNCTKSFGEVVNDLHKSYVNISISTITNVKCNGSADGSISAAASGGAEPYKFYLKLNGVATGDTTGISSGSFTGLEPVSGYTIEAYDKNECGPDTSETVSITEPIALSITGESAQNATAKYPWNGSLTVVASGGTGRLTYTLDTLSQDDGLFTNLSPGSYKVTVIDQNACGPDTSSILTISDATDIPGLVQGTIRMYPNPARDNLIIEFGEEVTKDVLIEIMSMTGQVVFKVKLNKDVLRDGRYTFDLASQPRGVYLLKINNQVVKEKIVLQ